jgi:hypothetical protein
MIGCYIDEKVDLPARKKGQSYKEYNEKIDEFFLNYTESYKWRERVYRSFWKNFREDFLKDPSYVYVLKYLYKKNVSLENLNLRGWVESRKEIISPINRKSMLNSYPKTVPFLRIGDSSIVEKKLKENSKIRRVLSEDWND